MADPAQIGQAFVRHYYSTYDQDRSQLASLYQAESKMTYEGTQVAGRDAIMNHFINNVTFKNIVHNIKDVDCQPSGAGTGVLIMVRGELKVDDNENPLMFVQSFHLLPADASGANYWVHNDIFRLNYA